jgi:hypothetical protein
MVTVGEQPTKNNKRNGWTFNVALLKAYIRAESPQESLGHPSLDCGTCTPGKLRLTKLRVGKQVGCECSFARFRPFLALGVLPFQRTSKGKPFPFNIANLKAFEKIS